MHARDGAIWRARFDGFGFPFEVVERVRGERYGRETALLRAVMREAVFANVEVAAACATMPLVRQTANQILLKLVVVIEREEGLPPRIQDLVVDALLRRLERLQLAGMIMNDADRALETEFMRAARDNQRVFGLADGAPQHRVDRDVELRELRQQTEFLIQNLEA